MSTINLSQSAPKRLIYSEGRWSLEVERWHAVDLDLFTPVLSYIAGRDAILGYLGDTVVDANTVAQARQIVSEPGHESTAFELKAGQWTAQTRFLSLGTDRPPPGAQKQVAQLGAQLQSLEQRFAQLEELLRARLPEPQNEPRVAHDEEAQSHAG